MPDKIYLRQMQGLPLIAKVRKTQLRIREWYEHFNGDVYVSFSGGKDSTVLAHLVHELYPDVPLVFSNTGLEYPEIQAFARKMGAVFVRPTMRFDQVISKYGYPIISKEVADAIYYARRIKNAGLETERRRGNLTGDPESWKNPNDSHRGGGGTNTRPVREDSCWEIFPWSKRSFLMGVSPRIGKEKNSEEQEKTEPG